jgi:hypothetical protein
LRADKALLRRNVSGHSFAGREEAAQFARSSELLTAEVQPVSRPRKSLIAASIHSRAPHELTNILQE